MKPSNYLEKQNQIRAGIFLDPSEEKKKLFLSLDYMVFANEKPMNSMPTSARLISGASMNYIIKYVDGPNFAEERIIQK